MSLSPVVRKSNYQTWQTLSAGFTIGRPALQENARENSGMFTQHAVDTILRRGMRVSHGTDAQILGAFICFRSEEKTLATYACPSASPKL